MNEWTRTTTPPPIDSTHKALGTPASRPIILRWLDGYEVVKAVYLPDPVLGGRWHADHDPIFSCEWWPVDSAAAPFYWRYQTESEATR